MAGARSLQASAEMEKHLLEPQLAFCWGLCLAPIPLASCPFTISLPAPPPLLGGQGRVRALLRASSTLARAHLFLFPHGLLEAEAFCLFISPGAGEVVQFS